MYRSVIFLNLALLFLASLGFVSPRQCLAQTEVPREMVVNPELRIDYISRSQMWSKTNIPSLNLREGPSTGYSMNQPIECTYSEATKADLGGTTPKFQCTTADGKMVRVKYGKTNPKVYTTVVTSRLLWALGYGADRVTPVVVSCHDCPPDPWNNPKAKPGTTQVFDAAVVVKSVKGTSITTTAGADSNWSWELDLPYVSEAAGGATQAQVDGLKLIASIIQHGDSKADQQKLICPVGSLSADGTCANPYMYVHDFGNTFGKGGFKVTALNFDAWKNSKVWKHEKTCITNIKCDGKKRHGLNYPKISEAGRVFLAGLLKQFSRNQILDMFEAANIQNYDGIHTADQWTDLFLKKVQEITDRPACE